MSDNIISNIFFLKIKVKSFIKMILRHFISVACVSTLCGALHKRGLSAMLTAAASPPLMLFFFPVEILPCAYCIA